MKWRRRLVTFWIIVSCLWVLFAVTRLAVSAHEVAQEIAYARQCDRQYSETGSHRGCLVLDVLPPPSPLYASIAAVFGPPAMLLVLGGVGWYVVAGMRRLVARNSN